MIGTLEKKLLTGAMIGEKMRKNIYTQSTRHLTDIQEI